MIVCNGLSVAVDTAIQPYLFRVVRLIFRRNLQDSRYSFLVVTNQSTNVIGDLDTCEREGRRD